MFLRLADAITTPKIYSYYEARSGFIQVTSVAYYEGGSLITDINRYDNLCRKSTCSGAGAGSFISESNRCESTAHRPIRSPEHSVIINERFLSPLQGEEAGL